jgi:hypothetical protein
MRMERDPEHRRMLNRLRRHLIGKGIEESEVDRRIAAALNEEFDL